MKYLTTYLDDEINFKFGNNGSIIELKAVDDHAVMSFSNEEKLLIRIKNEESYIKTVPVTAERKIIQLPTKLLKDLTVGQYDVELWQGEGDDQVIYPDEGFLRLKIHGNASQIDGSLVSSITLADFEKKFNELAQKIEGKLEKLPDIDGKNISIDVKVVDGNLCINGKDTGINLTAKDGRDGRDGHTPEITVSDAGTLVVDGIDTNKSLIGPRGENGLPGKDGVAGQDGKSAYQVAVDNGFDGTEVEWLRSLHGNDGLDGKSGRDGLPGQSGKSAYEIAIANGFMGTETEWLESLKGKDGRDGNDANVDLSEFLTKETANSEYAKKNDVPLIVYDAENNTLTINGQNVEIPSQVDLSSYVTKTDADKYALKSDVKNIVLDKNERTLTVGKESINIPNSIDLSPYYTKEEIDKKLTGIATNGKVDLTGYLRQSDLTDYAKKSDIPSQPDLTPYAKKTEVPQVSIDMEKRTITLNGNTIDIPSSVDLTDYAKKSEIPSIVLDGETNTLTINGTKVVIPGNVDLTPYYTKGEIDEKLADIQSGGKIDLSNYVNKQDLDGYAKKSEIPSTPDLTPYETKENAEKTYATKQALADIQLTPGKDGENGKSAYDIAKEHGYTDTEENWLKSLHGRDGIDGESGQNGVNGLSAYEVAQKNGFSGAEQEWLNSLKGQDGKDGSQGPRGEQGVQGLPGKDGQSAYQLWLSQGNSGSEIDFLNSLKGAKGEQGIPGKDGIPGAKGETGEKGPQGERGETGLQGPAGKNGADGKQGPKGDTGLQGPQGPIGPKGEKGDRGPAGPQGIQGPKGDPGQIPDVSNINKGISDNKSDISKINLKMSTMFVNLLDFGAQPENVDFDNAPAFNKAIQALPSVGGTIFIPNGNYFLKSTVNIDRSYVHVMGLNHGLRSGIDPVDGSTQAGGGGAKVTVQNPITAFKLENTHNNNRLSGITFSGFDLRGDTNAGVGIDGISNTDRVVIDNMTINNVGIGVRLHAADAPRITNSWIAETQSSILLTGASQQAEIKNNSLGAQPKGTTIYMENPDRFNISGNNIYPDGASAIRILNPVHGSIVGNTISAYYNGMIEFLPNSEGTFGNGNVISSNVIALESWHDNPDGKDNKWGIVHTEAFSNVISDNNILANGSPADTTGILVMKGDYNRIANNVMNISDTNSKVVINGAANNNWVIYSTEGFAFQDGGNQSNKNIGI